MRVKKIKMSVFSIEVCAEDEQSFFCCNSPSRICCARINSEKEKSVYDGISRKIQLRPGLRRGHCFLGRQTNIRAPNSLKVYRNPLMGPIKHWLDHPAAVVVHSKHLNSPLKKSDWCTQHYIAHHHEYLLRCLMSFQSSHTKNNTDRDVIGGQTYW